MWFLNSDTSYSHTIGYSVRQMWVLSSLFKVQKNVNYLHNFKISRNILYYIIEANKFPSSDLRPLDSCNSFCCGQLLCN